MGSRASIAVVADTVLPHSESDFYGRLGVGAHFVRTLSGPTHPFGLNEHRRVQGKHWHATMRGVESSGPASVSSARLVVMTASALGQDLHQGAALKAHFLSLEYLSQTPDPHRANL